MTYTLIRVSRDKEEWRFASARGMKWRLKRHGHTHVFCLDESKLTVTITVADKTAHLVVCHSQKMNYRICRFKDNVIQNQQSLNRALFEMLSAKILKEIEAHYNRGYSGRRNELMDMSQDRLASLAQQIMH